MGALNVATTLVGMFLLILGIILAFTLGTDKRLGLGWSLFFVLCGALPGIIFIILSPPAKNLPPPKKSDIIYNIFFGILWLLVAVNTFYKLYTMPSYQAESYSTAYLMVRLVPVLLGLIGAYYFFSQYQRHKQLYEMQNS